MKRNQAVSVASVLCWLLTVSVGDGAEQMGWPRGGDASGGQVMAGPLPIDLDGDGRMEVIVPRFDDNLYVYDHVGRTVSGWPQQLGFADGTLASVAVGDVDGDDAVEIVVVGDDNQSQNATVKVYETSGTLLASVLLSATASGKATPCLIDCYRYSGPTAGDRHAAEEIVVRDGDGKLHVLYWSGSGFLDHADGSSTYQTVADDDLRDRFGSQPITSSAAAVSVGNGQTRIVVGSTDNCVYQWTVASTTGGNWAIDRWTSCTVAGGAVKFLGSPALADLDGDGDHEIAIGGTDGRMYVWEGDGSGSAFTGWPQQTPNGILASPAVADVDGDGGLDVVVGANDGKVYAWNRFGVLLSGWPAKTQGDVFASPAVADLDRDTTGSEVVAASLDGHLYAWSKSGELLPYWPKRLNTPLFASPAVGNIHGGDRMAIVVGGYDGRVFVWDLSERSSDPSAGWLQFRGGPKRQGQ